MPDGRLRILGIGDAKSRHFARWARRLAERGHEVHVASGRVNPRGELEGLHVHQFQELDPLLRVPVLRRFRMAGALARLSDRVQPDVVHSHYLMPYGYWAARAGKHVWLGGHWALPPGPNYIWEPARWVDEGGAQVFYDGHWRPGEDPDPYQAYQPPPPPVQETVTEVPPPPPPEEEAITIANDTVYGLGAHLQSSDPARARRVAARIRAGQVLINYPAWNGHAPFGGYKRSGNGREFGVHGLEEYLETKAILGY